MTETELESALGPSDSRQPKQEPGLQVWSYHLPTNLTLVLQDGQLLSISATGLGCAPLVWRGHKVCVLGATPGQIEAEIGEPDERLEQTWVYRVKDQSPWLKLYFEGNIVQAVLLGQRTEP